LSTAEAAAKGALGGLLVAFAWMHRGTIGMLFGGALIGALLTGWYWNDTANAAQMRKAIDTNYSMKATHIDHTATSHRVRVIVANASAYDMSEMQLDCGSAVSDGSDQIAKSNSAEEFTFDFALGSPMPDGTCKINYKPIDRRKLGEQAHDIKSAGTF